MRWNSFVLASVGSAAYVAIAAPVFNIASFYTVNLKTGGQPGDVPVELVVAPTSGVIPSWCKEGAAVTLAGTIGSASGPSIAGGYVIQSIAADGSSFTVHIPSRIGLTKTYTSGVPASLTGGTCTLIIQAQKVMFNVVGGSNVNLTDSVDASGNPGAVVGISTGATTWWEHDSPVGTKFDLADWYVKSTAGTESLQIRFL